MQISLVESSISDMFNKLNFWYNILSFTNICEFDDCKGSGGCLFHLSITSTRLSDI